MRRRAGALAAIGAALGFLSLAAGTADPGALPSELGPFVGKGTRVLAVESADLDRDGRKDYVLILEKLDAQGDPEDIEEGQRPLLVILRGADGKLGLAKRSDRAVLCSRCGGIMGDPFDALSAGPGTFSISHYGGSAWRWGTLHRFDYSRRDRTWQLVRAEETSFHATDPSTSEKRVYRPPRDFGKIDLADFDPETYRKRK